MSSPLLAHFVFFMYFAKDISEMFAYDSNHSPFFCCSKQKSGNITVSDTVTNAENSVLHFFWKRQKKKDVFTSDIPTLREGMQQNQPCFSQRELIYPCSIVVLDGGD